ncbi:MAG: hypothetical protein A2W22_03970 [Candidatus Levybacteria bacterium RBG_16_35_11]|nr:MAG: hypothetical protein A2W22_03970 [Candidatus Levybacteria bacterium RBG_16_35_11]
MSEQTTEVTTTKGPPGGKERRSQERFLDEETFRGYKAWSKSLRDRVQNGALEKEDADVLLATALMRRDKRLERDRMTRLYRQELLRPKIDEMIKIGKPFGILITDLDRFGEINKLYGQNAGDDVIVQAAMRVTEGLREESKGRLEDFPFPYRSGGDENAVILPGIDSLSKLKVVTDKISDAIKYAPFPIPHKRGVELNLTISIGGTLWSGEDTEELLEKASQNLKDAKQQRDTTVLR